MRQVLVAMALVMLVGCGSFGGSYYSEVAPTVESVAAAGGVQVYQGTAYLTSDFKENGELRAFGDYDFMVESAPCTVLGAYEPLDATSEGVYASEAADKEGGTLTLVFTCREASPGNRLFLVGTSADCDTRAWDMGRYSTPLHRKISRLCMGSERPESLQAAATLSSWVNSR